MVSVTENSPEQEQAKDHFEVGGETLFPGESGSPTSEKSGLEDIRIRLGTLLKSENVSLLLGAGASKNCGGETLGTIPVRVEKDLIERGMSGKQRFKINEWLKVFYLAKLASMGDDAPDIRQYILDRRTEFGSEAKTKPFKVNFEQVLETLHHWRAAISVNGDRLHIDGKTRINAKRDDIDTCIENATRALARACDLSISDEYGGIGIQKKLIQKLLTRPLTLKRVNIFTLNYDTLIEQAADATGVSLMDGFIGTECRVFRPESYGWDMYFPAETTEGRVHRIDRVLHLYKLHGSITWTASKSSTENPYGIRSASFDPEEKNPILIYPTPTKQGEALGMPYSELFRHFANAVVQPQSVLIVIGFGFGDEHVNAIIRQALAISSFTLVIVDPCPNSDFVVKLRKQKDSRVWIFSGPTLGKLDGFVNNALPNLHDEKILREVVSTYTAITRQDSEKGDSANES